MTNPTALFLLMVPVFFAGAVNAAPPIQGAMVVIDKTAPFFHAAQVDPNGTDYLLFKGNKVALVKKEATRSFVKLPTGEAGLVASNALEVKTMPPILPAAFAHRKSLRVRSQQRAHKTASVHREPVPAPVFRY